MTRSVNTPWTLGLTGGIGSGKSAAAQHFIDLGGHVICLLYTSPSPRD